MRQRGAASHLLLNRRRVIVALLAGASVLPVAGAQRAIAQPATPAVSPVEDLERLLPAEDENPAGLELESAGTREDVAQIAGTFRNSRDASQLLARWGWVGNAYRSYTATAEAGSGTPARVEISLHQFTSSTGAAYALSYFAHDRAVMFQHQERLGEWLLPCEATVSGDGSATRFLRSGKLVVRVTVVIPASLDMEAEATVLALSTATDLALGVLARASGSEGDQLVAC